MGPSPVSLPKRQSCRRLPFSCRGVNLPHLPDCQRLTLTSSPCSLAEMAGSPVVNLV